MERSKIAVLIPAYNEQETIGSVVSRLSKYFDVWVFDDCSTDKTGEIASKNGARVVVNKKNLGYSANLNAGFYRLFEGNGYQYVITCDGDGQHYFLDTLTIANKLLEGFDLVIGERPKFQRIGERIFSLAFMWMHSLRDPLSGHKGYSRKLYASKGNFESLETVGSEIIRYAHRKNYKICTVKIQVFDRLDASRFGDGVTANYKLLKALVNVIFAKFQ